MLRFLLGVRLRPRHAVHNRMDGSRQLDTSNSQYGQELCLMHSLRQDQRKWWFHLEEI
jgi:hypothetical protein